MDILDGINRSTLALKRNPLAFISIICLAAAALFFKLFLVSNEARFVDLKIIQQGQQDKIDLLQQTVTLQSELSKSKDVIYQMELEKRDQAKK